MPAYNYDPYQYRVHKMKGGTFKNFNAKRFSALTGTEVQKHLRGEQFIGVYPLLKDNTSWFIVADFDKEDWAEACRQLIAACSALSIPAYLERSRSGEGGHVWVFFEKAYPAVRSRKILTALLEQTGGFSLFDKGASFDRLFPNQDFLSGKGLGNLIALPLNGMLVEKGHNCFIKPESLMPYSDQWAFLASIQRVTFAQLDKAYERLIDARKSSSINKPSSTLQIKLSNVIRLNHPAITLGLANFLKEELSFPNAAFFAKKQAGRNIWGTKRYFNLIEETETEAILPRGFVGKLLRYCREQGVDFEFIDQRRKKEPELFSCSFPLREYQKVAVEAAKKKDFGVIVAPPGSGKTIMGLKVIAEKQQPALIVVHRKQLLEQWVERIESFLGIPKQDIGKIGQGRSKVGKKITVAMIQTLSKKLNTEEDPDWVSQFGILIVDECHHIPADTFHKTIARFNSYYQYGFTATPFRKYSDGKLIFTQLGAVIAEIKPQQIESFQRARVVIRNTALEVPYNAKTDPFETLSNILIHDTSRNQLILEDVRRELQNGHKAVIITERRAHIQTLDQFLKGAYETVTLSGEDSEKSRQSKWKLLKAGDFQVVITTGQFFGEGTDLQNVARLFLVYPFSFKGKLIQYIGRVQRSEVAPVIYDYRDYKIDYLNKLFLNRNRYYRNLDRQATLFDEQEAEAPANKAVRIEQKMLVPIEELDFRYGAIAFVFNDPKLKHKLEFEIEHDYIRPEFEVLKPYFAKLAGSDKVEVDVFAEVEAGEVVAQTASCPVLEKINREAIEGVKFNYIEALISGGKLSKETGEQEADYRKAEEENLEQLFASGEGVLEAVLKNKDVKHYRQLKYLAGKHEGALQKLRFMLHPFAFMFFLSGDKQYHVVLETLNTEEATYVWHLECRQQELPQHLIKVDRDLAVIRNRGRQAFLAEAPKSFSRIIHNYSDERKGFILWRDMLEEQLF